MPQTHRLRIFLPSSPDLRGPPQMTRQVYRPALIWLLQQPASMQGCLRDQSIVVLPRKPSSLVQRSCNDTKGLVLRSRIAYGLLVHGECLSEEFVADFLEGGLVSDIAGRNEEAQRQVGRIRYASVQGGKG